MNRLKMKKTIKAFCFLFLMSTFVFSVPLLGFSQTNQNAKSEVLYKKAQEEYYSLLRFSNFEIKRAKWIETAQKFKDIWGSYPNTISGYKALFTSSKLYQKSFARFGDSGDLKKALEGFQKVATVDKEGYLGDDALFNAGELFLSQNNYGAASLSFQTVLNVFPKGDMVNRAKQRLALVKNRIAKRKTQKVAKVAKIKRPIIISDVNFNSKYSQEWLTIETDRRLPFFSKWIAEPSRYIIDLPDSRVSDSVLKNIKLSGRYLKQVRVVPISNLGNRVVLEFKAPKKINIRTFQEKNVIKVSILPKKVVKRVATKPSYQKAKVTKQLESIPENRVVSNKSNRKVPYIVIDPGHGGKDYGAVGGKGLLEKNLNLAISKNLVRILEQKYAFKVAITRDDDRFITLEARGKFANEKDADLFVSIHVNAAERKGAHGIETYYLGRGSSDRARDTAKRENGELVYKVPDNDVQKILTDMITNRKINDSSVLARWIQDKLFLKMSKKYSHIKNLGVKEGPFFVLHSTKMPSVLVEVGFITNSSERKRLSKPQYLNRLAESIAQGISYYLKDNKPTI